jgi:hypothetical protein
VATPVFRSNSSNPSTTSTPVRPGFGRQSFGLHGFAAQADAGPAPGGNLASQFGFAVAYADPMGLSELARHFQAPLPEAAADLPRVAATLTGARHASLWPGPLSPPPAPQDMSEPAAHEAGSSLETADRDGRAAHAAVPAPTQVLELGAETLAVLRGIETQLATLTRLVEAQAATRQPDQQSEPFGELAHGDATQPMTWPPLGESIENLQERDVAGDAAPVLPGMTQVQDSAVGLAFAGDRLIAPAIDEAGAGMLHLPAAMNVSPSADHSPELPRRALFPAGSADPQRMAEEAERIARIHRATLAARQAADAVRDFDATPGAPAFVSGEAPASAAARANEPAFAKTYPAQNSPAPGPLAERTAHETVAPGEIGQAGESSGMLAFLAFALPRWLGLIAVILAAGIVLHLLTGGTLDTLPAGLVSAEWWGGLFTRIYRMLERIDRFMLDLVAPLQRVIGA